ncbi:extracellular matrix organizing protein FRAS1-like [Oncorhynchus keta]|uniref:extracellular matrix organizing protein FRAS1-like n=1 Tax=Oncorhynchus keta TaxID=8018 RepID=UPI00227AED76|nr:extracellular matrix organizing protein FRAS1-like [Oncorhynchus keta]
MISSPKYGFIENTRRRVGSLGGSNTLVISPEVPFSMDDLTTDHIFYVQNVQNTDHHYQDTFSFYISDGSSQTEAFNVNIDILQTKEEMEPVVSVNRVQVEQNSGVVITNSSLNVLDQDTPDNDIIITVTKQPAYGKLRRTPVLLPASGERSDPVSGVHVHLPGRGRPASGVHSLTLLAGVQ